MQYRTLEFVPVDDAAWVEELHTLVEAQGAEGFVFVGAVTREVVREQVGGMAGRAASMQSTALIFGNPT